jgi:hypothetical protein
MQGKLEAITERVFAHCETLSTASMPNTVADSIGSQAFLGCQQLSLFEVPQHVTDIGASAFLNSSLSSIIIRGKIMAIGKDAFSGTELDKGMGNITLYEDLSPDLVQSLVKCRKPTFKPTTVKTEDGTLLTIDCECPPEERYDEGTDRCISCKDYAEYLSCPGGHRMDNEGRRDKTVTVKESFMTVEEGGSPYSIYGCSVPDACKGDRYVNMDRGSMCSNGFDSGVVRCARCPAGTVLGERCELSDGEVVCEDICEKCDTNILSLLLSISITAVCMVFGTFMLYRSNDQEPGASDADLPLLAEFVQIVQAMCFAFRIPYPRHVNLCTLLPLYTGICPKSFLAYPTDWFLRGPCLHC